MSLRLTTAIAVLAMLASTSAVATTYAPVTIKCPVGGDKIKHHEMMSDTTWGQMPDGTRLGAAGSYPTPMAECPKNGLVLYRDFEKSEIGSLSALVQSTEYASLRQSEVPYYRAYWLARKMGDKDEVAWLLLAATQQAKNASNPERIARYQKEFIELTGVAPFDGKDLRSIALAARRANALRELSRFEEAKVALTEIVIADSAGGSASDAAENRSGWREFLVQLAAVVARRDSRRAPLDMIGDREAAYQCAAPSIPRLKDAFPALGEFETRYCERPEIKKTVAAILEMEKAR